jgi:beta-glucosidase
VILVVLAGRPLELKWAAAHVPAILEAWSPGIEAGPPWPMCSSAT